MKQVAGFWGAVIVSALLWVLIIWGISSARAESPPMMNKSSSNWVKGWEIASFVNPKNGEFSHCTLSTIYTPSNAENRKRMKADQMSLNIKLFPDTSTGFLLGSPDWKFVPNKSYLLRFNFTDEGRESYFSAKMVAEDEHYIVSEGPSDSRRRPCSRRELPGCVVCRSSLSPECLGSRNGRSKG